MEHHGQSVGGEEQRRELVRVATGVVIGRYGVTPETAEKVLMDWARISGIVVYDLALRVADDARRGGAPVEE